MAHTATATVTATALTLNTATADIVMSGGTAFTDASTLEIAYPREGKLLIMINSTYAGANTAIVEAGEFLSNGQSTITVTTAENGVYAIVIESSRCKDFDGMVNLTFGTSNTGFVRALSLPY
jgi:hypothetical protein